ncbi:UTRA domain-containing protein [Paracoccus sp. APAP_BH8]
MQALLTSQQKAAQEGLPEGRELIHLRTVHYGDDRPFQAEDRWINHS